jgi:competence protein ComEC
MVSTNSSGLYEVIFVNVYQGDCIIFKSRYGKEIYMVDTGGSRTYDIASNVLVPLFELLNVDCIRTLIITHSDYDHCGALDNLVELIEIKNIYYQVENIDIFGFEFINLNDGVYDNANDNSIVLYGEYYYLKLLLMGDVSSKVEKDIIVKYPTLDVDIIKVAHHGSKYSTCIELLEEYHPRVAILSYGYNNYGHPSLEVVNRLKSIGSRIYSTYKDGTLIFFSDYEKEIYLRMLK